MSAGLNPSKNEIDTMAGVIARDLQSAMLRVYGFKYFLDGKTDSDLESLGYVAADIANLRSAYADLDQLVSIYQGAATLSVAKDFRTFMRRIFGMGAL